MKITKPGIYFDVPERDYHADPLPEPSLSNSVAVAILHQSPAHAHAMHPRLGGENEFDSASNLDIGSAIHAGVTRTEAALHVINADSYRTKDAQTQRQQAWEAGKIPLLIGQFEGVKRAIDAARRQIVVHEIAPDWRAGRGEVTVAWQENVGGVEFWCRARVDWLPESGEAVYDLKTTAGTADPDTWTRRLFDGGYDMQAAFYARGLRAVGARKRPEFRYAVLEQKRPHALSVAALDPQAVHMAGEKVEMALHLWAECIKADRWPGYPNRICYAEAPPWEATKHEMRKERARHAREIDGSLIKQMIHWQSPTKVAAE